MPVYDLTVDGEHEFFANGVLVHNCEYFNRRVKAAPYQAKRVRAWDKAATKNQTSAYTAGVLMALADDGCYYLEDVVHGQWQPDERDDIILATAYKDRTRYGPKYAPQIWVEQEPGSAGIDSFRFLAKKLAGFPVFADRPTGAKEVRAEPWSSQCAARNIVLVEADWDINGWIDEHIHFPLGRLKDRVDASSMCFAHLHNRTRAGTLTTYTFKGGKKKALRILLVERRKLAEVVITEHTALLINLTDPLPVPDVVAEEVMSLDGEMSQVPRALQRIQPSVSPVCEVVAGEEPPVLTPPPHGLTRLLGQLELAFADLQPAECQEHWDEPREPYGKKPAELIFDRPRGKKLWKFLISNRGADLLVLVDDGDRRALSLAYALCDVLNLSRSQTIYRYGQDEWKADGKAVPPNEHVFSLVKECRSLVVG